MARFVFTVFTVLFPLCLLSQGESRLALVIGNSAYKEGALQNPVNDAVLVGATLRDLNFDVILGTDISSKQEFVQLIRDFGSKRADYDVALVYYAGHGVQIGSENFLLPTGEVFESDFDVMDYGVSVQNILRYLNSVTDKVNVLILDACRNNPFEQKWNPTRSVAQGQGLAKMSPPTGSLIAFSTEAGSTAPDGGGRNSWYSLSLCKNMRLVDTSLDQVFRNVRKEVLEVTDGNQRPVEASQLTGAAYFLNKSSDDGLLRSIDSLLVGSSYSEAEKLVDAFLMFNSRDPRFLAKKGHITLLRGGQGDTLAAKYYRMALEIDTSYFEAIQSTIHFENTDEDLGLLVCLDDVETRRMMEHYINVYPDCFDLLISQARRNYFSDDPANFSLGMEQLLDLRSRVEEGAIDFSRSVDIGEGNVDIAHMLDNNMMYALSAQGDWEGVIRWSEKCQKQDADDPWPYHMMGRAYAELIPTMVDSVEMRSASIAMAEAYREGLVLAQDDKRLYFVLAPEYIEDVILTFLGLGIEEYDEVDVAIQLGEEVVSEISDEYVEHPGFWRNSIRLNVAFVEILRGEYFRGLKRTAQAMAESQLFKDFPWLEFQAIEMEAFAYSQMEEWELFCESLAILVGIVENDGVSYGQFWSAEQILGGHELNCND